MVTTSETALIAKDSDECRHQKTQRDLSLDVIISTMIGCKPCCHGNDFSLDDESSGDAHAQNQSVSLLTSLIPL